MATGKKFRLVPWLLVLLPAWLIASAVFALVKYFKDEEKTEAEAEKRFARAVSTPLIADDLRKIVTVIGERNTTKPANLASASSMVAGLLGPSNTGYEVKSIDGPSGFQILQTTIPGTGENAAPIWVLTSYDSPIGSRGAEKNATGLAATMAAAQALANSSPAHSIHFIFLPHANEADSPLVETALIVANLIKAASPPKAILCVEAMGDAESLILSSRDTEALPTAEFDGLGKILGAEVVCLGDDFDLASTLFEMDLPALRVSTRTMLLPDENDDKLPFAPTLAASTGRLISFLQRLAQIPS